MNKPAPATIIASAALFFSLGGTGLAADHYLITSTKQIAPNVRLALKGDRGLPGAAGQTGATGAIGAQGTAGAPGSTANLTFDANFSTSARATLTPGVPATEVVDCPAGQVVVDGGYQGTNETVTSAFAKDPYEWVVTASMPTYQTPGVTGSIQAWAWCAAS